MIHLKIYAFIFSFLFTLTLQAKPLKVYILSGQSNMEGHADIRTFGVMAKDPVTAPILKEMLGPDGQPRILDEAYISYFTGGGDRLGEGFGKLTAGWGSRRDPKQSNNKIGPEFTFGIYMQKSLKEPILIIKTAWGGKSLHTDFRPPSAGPYRFNEKELENIKKRGKNLAEIKAEKAKKTGHFYRLMIKHVKHVLSDIKRVYPKYDSQQGYELAGFAWFQGWNDMVASGTYPNRGQPGGYAQYSECMAHFIRDVRKDLSAPKMKFVIGVMGVGGPLDKYTSQRYVPIHGGFRRAMAQPASLPEFKGNVTAVETAPFWDMRLKAIEENQGKVKQLARFLKSKHKDYPNKDGSMDSKAQKAHVEKFRKTLLSDEDLAYAKAARSNGGYHYYGSAKTMSQIGKAFAEAILKMESD